LAFEQSKVVNNIFLPQGIIIQLLDTISFLLDLTGPWVP